MECHAVNNIFIQFSKDTFQKRQVQDETLRKRTRVTQTQIQNRKETRCCPLRVESKHPLGASPEEATCTERPATCMATCDLHGDISRRAQPKISRRGWESVFLNRAHG